MKTMLREHKGKVIVSSLTILLPMVTNSLWWGTGFGPRFCCWFCSGWPSSSLSMIKEIAIKAGKRWAWSCGWCQ